MSEKGKKTPIAEEAIKEEDVSLEEEVETDQEEETASEETEQSEELSKEDEDLNTKYLRLMADFQNFKRRAEKQRSDIHAYANEKIATDLLTVLDNFERALEHEATGAEAFKEGMELIFTQLKDVLKASGVHEIEAEEAQFDPNFHNAVMMEDTDAVSSGYISAVLQKGYTLNGKVIRPSMVKVAN
ncbi:MAG: nucleotide exchange factor GrpE [Anaerovoracaceae bacterium]